MSLVTDWQALEAAFPSDWQETRVTLALEEAAELDRSLALLAPLQPVRAGGNTISIRVVRSGAGPGVEAVRRGFARLDFERLHGRLTTATTESRVATEAEPLRTPTAEKTLAESWDEALATLPSDWSDVLGEIELDSSDYLEPGAVQLAPINPRRLGSDQRLQFRSARSFGFGATPGMVRRCLERCDTIGIHGRVHIVRALSDTQPVGTQGPVWQIDGRFV